MEILKRIDIIIGKLSQRNKKIAIAESCTGGYISHMITNIPGASKVFDRAIISYSNQSKIDLLNINSNSINEHGAVSEPVAFEMAKNVKDLAGVDIGIGITGIAGPTGDTPEKPIGLVYIGFATENRVDVKKFIFKDDRIGFKKLVLNQILELLEHYL